jgi:transcription termination/antitermination protein NusA
MKLDVKLLGYIKYFENYTHTKVKDCFEDENGAVVFIVNEGEIGKAIGKAGSNVKKLSFKMKKRLRVIEYSANVVKFVRNVIMPVRAKDVNEEEGKILIIVENNQDKAMLLGRNKSKLKEINEIVKKYFKVSVEIGKTY